jgi:hypothetical protein
MGGELLHLLVFAMIIASSILLSRSNLARKKIFKLPLLYIMLVVVVKGLEVEKVWEFQLKLGDNFLLRTNKKFRRVPFHTRSASLFRQSRKVLELVFLNSSLGSSTSRGNSGRGIVRGRLVRCCDFCLIFWVKFKCKGIKHFEVSVRRNQKGTEMSEMGQ